ncbi:rhodanese-like domain-containing protein [Nodosilinea sp. LEGE 07088]|uniref:rhodanese-like domain-containing protein n=1 Tax=Nodosilinea sp. LEGE 07088 TaxID=2777968 RepID=UPI0018823758|nr:rhodanese-like domain-containing protein [Nodosilinea sp. LEGE 07088]MBE9136450.1 rhodanese-like domain-containing protein [Nodosilinea sp. LEGE 07088]
MDSMSSLTPSVVELTPEEFVHRPHPPRLIDVRSGLEYAQFHAPGAISLSLPRILMGRLPWLKTWVLPHWFRTLPKTEAIALICLTAHRSPLAAQTLVKDGFSQVFNITGGMVAWQKAGLPTQKGTAKTAEVSD